MRKTRELETGPSLRQKKSKITEECTFPGQQERLPLYIPGAYQLAMGTREETIAWLRGVPLNVQAILITFSDEASYRTCGPTIWYAAQELPKIIARIQRRRFEQLVDALTLL